ncbi:hypothetical protein MKY29_11980 [Psychrobacillus sp. FSL K6-2365]|jgi:hypothetical protein|uniref:hypothetical protein n=1 Tax=Psychrobacillus sp. FSL K6-2365 TaxID=2921546 RepID=UPI0030F573BA
MSFELDLSELDRAFLRSPQIVGETTEEVLDEIKDDWVMEARDIAPLKSGNLRQQIKGTVQESGMNSSVMVTGNATNRTGNGDFNYGYYIHELDAGGDSLRTPGTEKKFLEKSVDETKWQRMLVQRVLNKLRGLGWDG